MTPWRLARIATLASLLGLPGCAGSGSMLGSEGYACLPEQTCREGLVCGPDSRCWRPGWGACPEITCSWQGVCVDVDEGRSACACLDGYHDTGQDCSVNDPSDPCLGVTCQDHGTCTVIHGDLPTCLCEPGFHDVGPLCVRNDPDAPCLGVGCAAEGTGTCAVVDGQPSCTCAGDRELVGTSCMPPWHDRWVRLDTTGGPPPWPYDAQVAYDPVRDRLVMFVVGPDRVAATWELDAGTWIEVSPPVQPAPRLNSAMVYDASRQRVLLFGGVHADDWEELADTWAYDGSTWTEVPTAHAPSPRYFHGLAYHEALGVTVLQGGACGYSVHCDATDSPDILYSDTWTLDGTDWTPLSLTSPPDAGYSHLLTYDASAAEVVLVTYTWYPHVQKTWRLAGSAWTRCADAGMPGERTPLQVTWDGIRSRLLGFVDDHWDSPQLWALEAGEWFSLALPAGPSSSAEPVGFTRDAAGRPVLLTYDDRRDSPWETWVLRSAPLHP